MYRRRPVTHGPGLNCHLGSRLYRAQRGRMRGCSRSELERYECRFSLRVKEEEPSSDFDTSCLSHLLPQAGEGPDRSSRTSRSCRWSRSYATMPLHRYRFGVAVAPAFLPVSDQAAALLRHHRCELRPHACCVGSTRSARAQRRGQAEQSLYHHHNATSGKSCLLPLACTQLKLAYAPLCASLTRP